MLFKELQKQAKDKLTAANEILASDHEAAKALIEEADNLEAQAKTAKDIHERQQKTAEAVMDITLPVDGENGNVHTISEPESEADVMSKSVNHIKYGNIEDVTSKAITEVFDGDYRQVNHDQSVAMRRYVRGGSDAFRPGDSRLLSRQVWHIDDVKSMLKDGLTVGEIKATMVEGVDVLGGYAVAPEMAADIIARTRGLTAVRDAGATVVQTASKSIEWLKVTQGGTQYPSAMRGLWGGETEAPTADNFEFGLITIPAQVYTYKVPMSTSLLEDATNVMEIFNRMVADTLAIDEDVVFMVGDGANKPYGIVPGQANGRSLTEVSSGSAAALTIAGLKKLRRGVDSQYRLAGRSTLVGNSASGEDIELFQDGQGRFYYDALIPGQVAPGGFVWRENEALADPAADSFSLVFGDFSGYAIVERAGLAIQRYNDSNTGINTVEFHIRRRLGGDVIEPWKFAVQKTEA